MSKFNVSIELSRGRRVVLDYLPEDETNELASKLNAVMQHGGTIAILDGDEIHTMNGNHIVSFTTKES